MPDPVYLDHAATTPVRAEVLEAMLPFMGARFGNPSSAHRWGRDARMALDEARERLAACLGAHSDEICFTSGGTEGDNFAILGVWRRRQNDGRPALLTTPVEHKAVLAAVHEAAREGDDERICSMTADGVVDEASFDALLDESVVIASVMWVNNEIGTVQPVDRLSSLAKSRGAVFHTDAVQAFGKVEVDARKVPFDLLSISGHKFGALKGCGALFIRRGTALQPLLYGGSQNRDRRPGTDNVAAAVGLARAAELAVAEREVECARLRMLRDRLEHAILKRVPNAVVHGRAAPVRAPHIVNVSVPGIESESMLMALDLRGIACSGGSACLSGSAMPSYVLTAIGVSPDLASGPIRMSLGALTTDACVARVVEVFPALVAKALGESTAAHAAGSRPESRAASRDAAAVALTAQR